MGEDHSLDVWLYGTAIARLTQDLSGRITLTWSGDALDRWGPGARLLSAKLTIGVPPVPAQVQNYLDGLLPEGNARVNHALAAGVAPADTFALVRAYGRDTPGAALFVPSGESGDPSGAGSYHLIDEAEVERRLLAADLYSPATDGVVDSSTLPGMIPKITLHRQDGDWYACAAGAASTWILKRAQNAGTDLADVVDTEVACLALARALRLTTVTAEVFRTERVRGIAVSRYDRTDTKGRLHQEDLAQAIGLSTADPNRKFQWGAAMPSLRSAADVLRLDGGNPDDLLRLLTFTTVVGNTDMHAKNISFLRHADGRVSLSPAYDIAMHLHHPRDNRRFALDVDGRFEVAQVDASALVAEGTAWGLPERRARRVVADLVDDLRDALGDIDREHHRGVSERAWAVVEARAEQFRLTPRSGPVRPPGRGRHGPRRPSSA